MTTTPVILDGGMGRELQRRGAPVTPTLWSAASLMQAPEAVVRAHASFIRAGAEIITTCNYTAVPSVLAAEGLASRFEELTETACRLAQEAREQTRHPDGRQVRIAGSLPPLISSYRPDRVAPLADALPVYRKIAEVLARYADVLLCETMSSAKEAFAAAQAASETGLPLWVSWTLEDEPTGKLRSGETVTRALEVLEGLPIEALLFNCSPPEAILKGLEKAARELRRRRKNILLGAYANAYQPIPPDYTLRAEVTALRKDLPPERYAGFAKEFVERGAGLVGGCCGMGPEHIAGLREIFSNR